MAFGDVVNTGTATSTAVVGSITTSTAISITVGNLLIAVVGHRSVPTAVNFTDSAGGSWTNLTAGSTASQTLWGSYRYITTISTNLTITASFNGTTAGSKVLIVQEFAGPFSSTPLDTNPAVVRVNSTTGVSNATGVLSQTGEFIFSYCGSNTNPPSYAVSAPFTVNTTVGVGGGSATTSIVTADSVSATTNSTTATWSSSNGINYVAIASFKPTPPSTFNWYPMDEIGLANERIINPSYEVTSY